MSSGTITKHQITGDRSVAIASEIDRPLMELLSAMGHTTNSSAITEEFVKLAHHSNTYNAANFGNPSDTTIVKIAAMIAHAIAQGATAANPAYGFIPASMFAYNTGATSLVAFSSAVHMVREGQGHWDEHDPIAYGADPDLPSNSFAALQATWDAATASTRRKTIRLYGDFYTEQPIWWSGEGIQLLSNAQGLGTSSHGVTRGSRIIGNFQGGPLCLIAGTAATVAGLTTSLATGSGQAWSCTDQDSGWWNLRDLKSFDLHSTTTICIECFYKCTIAPGAYSYTLITSTGKPLPNATLGQALQLKNASGKATWSVNVSGTTRTIADAATTMGDGSIHHIEASYDGTTLRLFVDGVLVDSAAHSGTITQGLFEEVYVGPSRVLPSEIFAVTSGIGGVIDGLRVSNTARHTSGFTAPTAKPSVDANTLALMIWDSQRGPLTRVQTKDGHAYLVQRNGTVPSSVFGAFVDGVGFDSAVTGALSMIHLHDHSEFWGARNLMFYNHRVGIHAPGGGNRFGWSLDRAEFNGLAVAPRFGICGNNFSGIGSISNVWMWGHRCSLVMQVSGMDYSNIFLQGTAISTQAGLVLGSRNASQVYHVMNNVNFNTESGVHADFIGGWFLGSGGDLGGVAATGCLIEGYGSAPAIIADSLDGSKFVGCNFSTGHTAVVQALGTFTRSMEFDKCDQNGTWVPWSDVAGTAIVAKIGPKTVTFGASPEFDCSLGDDFFLSTVFTANVTGATFIHVTPSQEIRLWVKQNGAGGFTLNTPANVKGMTAIDTTADHWSQWIFKAGLDGNLYQQSFNSGA